MEGIVQANQLKLWYQTFGDPRNPPLILQMGGGCQGIMWPEEFCQKLAHHGFYVIRYDCRDMGPSTPTLEPYTLADMAYDLKGFMEGLNIPQAYLVGTSMGGGISLIFSSLFPKMVKSQVVMCTTCDYSVFFDIVTGKKTNSPLSPPSLEYQTWLLKGLASRPATKEEKLAQVLQGWRLMNGSELPFDEDLYRNLLLLQFSRVKNPSGLDRHLQALKSSIQIVKDALPNIHVPTLIMQGTADPIFAPDHGQALAKAIPHADYVEIEGMGHYLNSRLFDKVAAIIHDYFL